jgi:hypothetical protein
MSKLSEEERWRYMLMLMYLVKVFNVMYMMMSDDDTFEEMKDKTSHAD